MPNNRAFVLMPFSKVFKEIYDEVYKKVCNANEFDCWRVDELSRPGSITRDIVEGIIEADIIIADLTTKNANVFYELGIAHTIGKKTIMTSQQQANIPFDISNYRIIFYDQTISGSKLLYENLDRALKELKKVIIETANPVQAVLSDRTIFGSKQKIPILKIINVSKLPQPIREIIEKENLMYIDDFKNINIDEIRSKYALGPASMSWILKIIVKNNLFDDYAKLQKYIFKNKISIAYDRRDDSVFLMERFKRY